MGHVIFTLINCVYRILKDQMKLDLCICETICRYHGNHICRHGYQLPVKSIKPIFENISWKVEQKTTVDRYQTCYANSTKGSIHESIWKNQQPPTIFVQDAKTEG